MKICELSDQALLRETENLVQRERGVLVQLLHHMREIERRRLFSELGYPSLFAYLVKKLQYSEDQASRRIASMRLLNDLPEIEEKIASGELTLMHLGMAFTLFRQEKNENKVDKLVILDQLKNKPKREAEKIILSFSSSQQKLAKDKIRATSQTMIEISFLADNSLEKKLTQLKSALAHKHPSISLGELVHMLCDLGIDKWINDTPHSAISRSALRKKIFTRDQNRCALCHSTHALEIDHITPRAKGGTNSPENLRLLCRHCNQRAAIKEFGMKKMGKYLN